MNEMISNLNGVRGALGSPAGVAGDEVFPAAELGKVCRQLVAPTHLALDRADINERHRALGHQMVDGSLALGRQWLRVRCATELGGLRGLSEGDVHGLLHGRRKGTDWIRGLVEMGIVVKRDLPGDRGWLVVLNPNFARWDVKWLYAPGERLAWLRSVGALSADLARQLVSREVEEWFPDLAAMLLESDVEAAWRAWRAGNGPAGAGEAQDAHVGTEAADGRGVSGGGALGAWERQQDARGVPMERTGLGVAGGSERVSGGEASSKTKVGCRAAGRSLGFDEGSRARVQVGKGIGLETFQNGLIQIGGLDRVKVEELKVRLNGDEREFCYAAQQIIGEEAWRVGCIGRAYGDGKIWLLRWRHGPSRAKCVQVFLEMLNTEAKPTKSRAAQAQDLWFQFGGRGLDHARFKKSKESL